MLNIKRNQTLKPFLILIHIIFMYDFDMNSDKVQSTYDSIVVAFDQILNGSQKTPFQLYRQPSANHNKRSKTEKNPLNILHVIIFS